MYYGERVSKRSKEKKIRRCIGMVDGRECGEKFMSEGWHNRKCPACHTYLKHTPVAYFYLDNVAVKHGLTK